MKLYKKKATSNIDLNKRIILNSKFQKGNFINWQKKKYNYILFKYFKKNKKNINILDIGCGTGIQTKIFIDFFKKPKILCTDISLESLFQLKKKYPQSHVRIKKLNMNKLKYFINKNNKYLDNFDLIHSSYAIYYANNPKKTLTELFDLLKKKGVLLISAPDEPHEMISFIRKKAFVSNKVLTTLRFFRKVLIPFFKSKADKKIVIFRKINFIKFNDITSFFKFWKSTTYYSKKYDLKIMKSLKKHKLNFKKTSGISAIQKN
tara:strand:- start:196 stop:981 length:786 start_codon:yes stop_codon:yes gene_type:complete